jgi:5,6,7,8-tetrahydromethanopterin hydro-lyase
MADIDGRIGDGFAGDPPNSSHVNIILASRGSATAAALLTAFAGPSPGHTPILVSAGTDNLRGPVWPATVMMNKATTTTEQHERLTFGAAQLGIAQGVLDAVADGVLKPDQQTLLFAAIYVPPQAHDETAMRLSTRAATRDAIQLALDGPDPDRIDAHLAHRDNLRNRFYAGE